MIDLRNIARHLHLPAEQLRVAADLLLQGYQPAFITRYRADETGSLPDSVIWPLKLAIERQQRLDAYKHKAIAQMGEGVELDDPCQGQLEQAQSEVEIESVLRAFRVRKQTRTNPDKGQDVSHLLEKMIAHSGDSTSDVSAWVASQLSVDAHQADQLLQQCSRLVGNLIASDARLAERMRRAIQSKASLHVELLTDQHADEQTAPAKLAKGNVGKKVVRDDSAKTKQASAKQPASISDGQPMPLTPADATTVPAGEHSSDDPTISHVVPSIIDDSSVQADPIPSPGVESDHDVHTGDYQEHELESDAIGDSEHALDDYDASHEESESVPTQAEISSLETAPAAAEGNPEKGKKRVTPIISKKPFEKMTPRQRRRRWLVSVLQPFRGLNRPLSKLTAYQLLMIGRGQRSQLAKIKLNYSVDALVGMARDIFVAPRHPLAGWFTRAAEEGVQRSLLAKLEHDALMELEEQAQQRLLERAVDQLRTALFQKPVRGHCILAIDTVGPKLAAVAVVDYRGRVLHADEVICSGQASNVGQNVIRLGELIHRFKVTTIVLSNGPARRFLVHTIAELMKQSASSNLRWSMVDRGGAEAYASSRIGNEELPEHNRRVRAAAWIARRLQDPLREMLKIEPNRLRLGSFQRELPQDILQRLVHETLMDCVAALGVDVRRASATELSNVPGIASAHAIQIAKLVDQGKITSRVELLKLMESWPELSSRQAIGLLRVYGSNETLDGTLIHPDDYRLAHKLIQATDLQQPPAAPEGWVAPELKLAIDAAARDSGAASGTANDTSADSLAATQTPATAAPIAEVSAENVPTVDEEAATATEFESQSASALSADAQSNAEADAAHQPGSFDANNESTSAPEPQRFEPTSCAPEYPEIAAVSADTKPVIDVEKIARGWQVGRAKLQGVANCIKNPFEDVRMHHDWVPMQTEIPTLENLKPGMTVWAVVVGVADFGAFVELGPECSGLIHVSRLSSQFVEDPHQCVQVGDLIQTWVISIDTQKKRVGLTALSPREQAEMARQDEARREQQQREQQQRHRDQPAQSGQRRFDNKRADRGQSEPAGDRKSRVTGNQRAGQGGGRRPQRDSDRKGSMASGAEGSNKPVVVKSKQPAKPITDAMQKGKEPLRSFSDLLQFYELQKTEDPKTLPPPPAPIEVVPPTEESAPPTEQ